MNNPHLSPDDVQRWIGALCPLTMMPFRDPVKAADGFTYSREPLEAWIRECGPCVSPLTGAAMISNVVRDPAAAATLAELLSNPAYTSLQGTGLVVVHSALFDDLDKIEQDLVADLGLRPPSIVCLGNESSGKSTLLERLIGFPVLPRDKDLCTRMIIRLQLRRGPYVPFKVSVVTRCKRRKVLSSEYVAAANLTAVVQRIMDAEVKRKAQTALVTDRELHVHLQLPHLCNMNILDLPGLVTTKVHGDDMPRLTRELAESVIDEEGLSATYLLLVEATMPANQSIAATLIEEKNLRNRCLGVHTKLDLLSPASDDESVVQLVTAKVLGKSPGSVPLGSMGWLGCANRAPPRATLEKVEVGRDVWRLHNMDMGEGQLLATLTGDTDHPLPAEALSRLGMGEVRKRVEEYFEYHLVVNWIPQLLARLKQAAVEMAHANVRLGWPMPPDPRYQPFTAALSSVAASRAGELLPLRHAAGWTPASIADLRSVLALRVDATLNLESHDWMFLTSCQPIIDALAKLRAYAHDRNTAWSSQGSLTAAEGQRRAQQERLAWRELAEALVAELHELSLPLAKRACEAIFTDPAEPTPNLPRAGVDPSVALGQESEAQQAAMTRLARFDQLRGGIEAQLMAGLANLSQAFLVKAEEQVATTNTAVMLTFDLTVGPAAPRCKLTCDERTAKLGDTLLAMWFDIVVQPLSEHLRRIAAGAECFTESCSEARIAGLRQAVTVMEVEARFAALRQQYLAQPPSWAAPSVEATLPTTASATSQEAAAKAAETAATDTALEPESYSPAVADAISLLATPSLQPSAEDAPCAPGGSDIKHRLLWRLWPAAPEHEGAEALAWFLPVPPLSCQPGVSGQR
jgi:hypothetical protein